MSLSWTTGLPSGVSLRKSHTRLVLFFRNRRTRVSFIVSRKVRLSQHRRFLYRQQQDVETYESALRELGWPVPPSSEGLSPLSVSLARSLLLSDLGCAWCAVTPWQFSGSWTPGFVGVVDVNPECPPCMWSSDMKWVLQTDTVQPLTLPDYSHLKMFHTALNSKQQQLPMSNGQLEEKGNDKNESASSSAGRAAAPAPRSPMAPSTATNSVLGSSSSGSQPLLASPSLPLESSTMLSSKRGNPTVAETVRESTKNKRTAARVTKVAAAPRRSKRHTPQRTPTEQPGKRVSSLEQTPAVNCKRNLMHSPVLANKRSKSVAANGVAHPRPSQAKTGQPEEANLVPDPVTPGRASRVPLTPQPSRGLLLHSNTVEDHDNITNRDEFGFRVGLAATAAAVVNAHEDVAAT